MDARSLPFRMVRLKTAGALVVAVVLAGHSVRAQQSSGTSQEPSAVPEPTQEIIVVAPEVVQRKTVGRATATGAPIEVISISRRVSYADLNLSKHEDTDELKKRIAETAKAACKQLDTLYPEALYPPMPSEQNCVKTATDEAQAVAATIIAAANK